MNLFPKFYDKPMKESIGFNNDFIVIKSLKYPKYTCLIVIWPNDELVNLNLSFTF